jgi:hypothetical protein
MWNAAQKISFGQGSMMAQSSGPFFIVFMSAVSPPEQRKLLHVAIEIRQDLITDESGQRMWTALFVRLLPKAYQRLIRPQVPK